MASRRTDRHEHRFAHDAGGAANRRRGHPRRDESVELQVLHDRARVRLADPGEEVADQPDARLRQVADRLAEIRRANPHVGIADQDHVVLAVPVHRRQALDLGIQPEGRTADDELGILVGKLALQPLARPRSPGRRRRPRRTGAGTTGNRAGKSCASSASSSSSSPLSGLKIVTGGDNRRQTAAARDPEQASHPPERRGHGHDRHQTEQEIGDIRRATCSKISLGGTVRPPSRSRRTDPQVGRAFRDARAAYARSQLPGAARRSRSATIGLHA